MQTEGRIKDLFSSPHSFLSKITWVMPYLKQKKNVEGASLADRAIQINLIMNVLIINWQIWFYKNNKIFHFKIYIFPRDN